VGKKKKKKEKKGEEKSFLSCYSSMLDLFGPNASNVSQPNS